MSYCRNRRTDTDAQHCDIWGFESSFRLPSQASSVAVRSTTDSDGEGGTGAWSVKITGLPSWDRAEASEIVTLRGTQSSQSFGRYVCINSVEVFLAGDVGINIGDITVTSMSGGLPLGRVYRGCGVNHDGIISIPEGRQLAVASVSLGSVRANRDTSVHAYLMVNNLSGWKCLRGFGAGQWQTDGLQVVGPAALKLRAIYSTDRDIWGAIDGAVIDGD